MDPLDLESMISQLRAKHNRMLIQQTNKNYSNKESGFMGQAKNTNHNEEKKHKFYRTKTLAPINEDRTQTPGSKSIRRIATVVEC